MEIENNSTHEQNDGGDEQFDHGENTNEQETEGDKGREMGESCFERREVQDEFGESEIMEKESQAKKREAMDEEIPATVLEEQKNQKAIEEAFLNETSALSINPKENQGEVERIKDNQGGEQRNEEIERENKGEDHMEVEQNEAKSIGSPEVEMNHLIEEIEDGELPSKEDQNLGINENPGKGHSPSLSKSSSSSELSIPFPILEQNSTNDQPKLTENGESSKENKRNESARIKSTNESGKNPFEDQWNGSEENKGKDVEPEPSEWGRQEASAGGWEEAKEKDKALANGKSEKEPKWGNESENRNFNKEKLENPRGGNFQKDRDSFGGGNSFGKERNGFENQNNGRFNRRNEGNPSWGENVKEQSIQKNQNESKSAWESEEKAPSMSNEWGQRNEIEQGGGWGEAMNEAGNDQGSKKTQDIQKNNSIRKTKAENSEGKQDGPSSSSQKATSSSWKFEENGNKTQITNESGGNQKTGSDPFSAWNSESKNSGKPETGSGWGEKKAIEASSDFGSAWNTETKEASTSGGWGAELTTPAVEKQTSEPTDDWAGVGGSSSGGFRNDQMENERGSGAFRGGGRGRGGFRGGRDGGGFRGRDGGGFRGRNGDGGDGEGFRGRDGGGFRGRNDNGGNFRGERGGGNFRDGGSSEGGNWQGNRNEGGGEGGRWNNRGNGNNSEWNSNQRDNSDGGNRSGGWNNRRDGFNNNRGGNERNNDGGGFNRSRGDQEGGNRWNNPRNNQNNSNGDDWTNGLNNNQKSGGENDNTKSGGWNSINKEADQTVSSSGGWASNKETEENNTAGGWNKSQEESNSGGGWKHNNNAQSARDGENGRWNQNRQEGTQDGPRENRRGWNNDRNNEQRGPNNNGGFGQRFQQQSETGERRGNFGGDRRGNFGGDRRGNFRERNGDGNESRPQERREFRRFGNDKDNSMENNQNNPEWESNRLENAPSQPERIGWDSASKETENQSKAAPPSWNKPSESTQSSWNAPSASQAEFSDAKQSKGDLWGSTSLDSPVENSGWGQPNSSQEPKTTQSKSPLKMAQTPSPIEEESQTKKGKEGSNTKATQTIFLDPRDLSPPSSSSFLGSSSLVKRSSGSQLSPYLSLASNDLSLLLRAHDQMVSSLSSSSLLKDLKETRIFPYLLSPHQKGLTNNIDSEGIAPEDQPLLEVQPDSSQAQKPIRKDVSGKNSKHHERSKITKFLTNRENIDLINVGCLELSEEFLPRLVLDLGETLMQGCEIKQLSSQALEKESCRVTVRDSKELFVLRRPFVQEFLRRLSSKFLIVVYTLGMKEFIMKTIDCLDQDKKLIKKNKSYFPKKEERANFSKEISKMGKRGLEKSSICFDDSLQIWGDSSLENVIPSKKFVPVKNASNFAKYARFHFSKEFSLDDEFLRYYEVLLFLISMMMTPSWETGENRLQ